MLQSYLKNFFNLTEESGPVGISPQTTKLREMQRFFGLQITGTLDTDTLALIKKPRCGVPDVNAYGYSTFGGNLKWEKDSLTYRWETYVNPDTHVLTHTNKDSDRFGNSDCFQVCRLV